MFFSLYLATNNCTDFLLFLIIKMTIKILKRNLKVPRYGLKSNFVLFFSNLITVVQHFCFCLYFFKINNIHVAHSLNIIPNNSKPWGPLDGSSDTQISALSSAVCARLKTTTHLLIILHFIKVSVFLCEKDWYSLKSLDMKALKV